MQGTGEALAESHGVPATPSNSCDSGEVMMSHGGHTAGDGLAGMVMVAI